MAQHDYNIANQAFPATRADINNALSAIVSLNSGATEPSTTFAYMLWLDTTTNTLKQRNAANSGWIVRGTLDETFVLSRSSNTILDISDRDKVLIATGSYTQTFDAVATLGDRWAIDVIVDAGVTLTLDPNASETIDGDTTKAIVGPAQGRIVCNGSMLRTLGFSGPGIDTTRIDVASAGTVNLTSSAPNTRHINITGTTTITAFTVAAGLCYFVRFNESLTLTNNASIVTQTGGNIVTQAGDTCVLRATAANTVEVLAYVPAVLNQQTSRSMVRLHSLNGYGSTNNKIRRFTTVVTNQGSDITYADSATLGASFTINRAGVYAISYSDNFSSAAEMGLSLNSAQLTTSFASITDADRLAIATTAGTAFTALAAWVGYLPSGSVIRAHTTGLGASLGNLGNFTITRVG